MYIATTFSVGIWLCIAEELVSYITLHAVLIFGSPFVSRIDHMINHHAFKSVHIRIDPSNVIKSIFIYLDNNYTGAYHDVEATATRLTSYGIDYELIQHYIRVMSAGYTYHFVTKSTCENAMQYWRKQNNPSIWNNLSKVTKKMNEEERDIFVTPLLCWLGRYVPHPSPHVYPPTPQPGKREERQVNQWCKILPHTGLYPRQCDGLLC